MKVLAIMGSYRKGGTIDTVTDEILEGARSEGAQTEKIVLRDQDIQWCRNCFCCYNDSDSDIGRCAIEDDMAGIVRKCAEADGIVLASSINSGSVTAVTKSFMERLTFTLARPTGRWLWFKGVPQTRIEKRKRAVVVTSAGMVPRYLRFLVSYPEYQLAGTAGMTLNADVVGKMFIGSISGRALRESELRRAFEMGRLLGVEKLPMARSALARLRSRIEPFGETASSMIKP